MILATKAQKVLVLAAHPDDAEISAGGLIANCCAKGVEVTIANFTTSAFVPGQAEKRQAASQKAAEILGCNLVWIEDGKHNQVEDIPEYELVGLVDELMSAERPDIVLCPWPLDSHIDHVRLSRAVTASMRRWSGDVYAYVPGEHRTPQFTKFSPTLYVDITDYLDQKTAAIAAYHEGTLSRSLQIDALKRIWSYYGTQCNTEFAEGYIQVRAIA